jgi:hypothetical protein
VWVLYALGIAIVGRCLVGLKLQIEAVYSV